MILADRVEARVLAERNAALIAMALGAEVTPPDPDEARSAFDAALVAEPAQVDREKELLLRGLGLR